MGRPDCNIIPMENFADIQSVHPFPARMAPSIVRDYMERAKSGLKVLDPMAGSGTTLAIARRMKHRAFGSDTDSLALLFAQTWVSDIDEGYIIKKGLRVLERAQTFHLRLKTNEAYPHSENSETRTFIDFWFDETNRKQLTSLATAISRLQDMADKSILWCAFSRMIITKKRWVSRAMDVSHSRPLL